MSPGHRYLEYPDFPGNHIAIEALWETEIMREGDYLVLPDGRMDLVIRCDDARAPDARVASMAIIGPSSRPKHIPVRAGQSFLGARFRPGFGGCLGVRPETLVDQAIRKDISGAEFENLASSQGLPDIGRALRDIARQRATLSPQPATSTLSAIAMLHASAGTATVGELANASGVPDRTLRRRMQQAVGLSPKVFAGVLRFQHAMRQLHLPDAASLAEVAADCGYSDQAHLTREFQRYGGFTPGQRLPATLVTLPLGRLAD